MNKEEVRRVLESKTAYRVLMDSSLKSQTKDRLIWLVRILEHNWAASELSLSQQAENLKDWEPVKHGHWWLEREPDGTPFCFHCSVCDDDGHHIGIKEATDYCPGCGAKMDEPEKGYEQPEKRPEKSYEVSE